MSIALLFLTYDNIYHLDEYKKKGYFSDCNIYIHPKKRQDVIPSLHKYIISENVPTEWGQISIVEATLALLKNAVVNQNNEWFVLLAQDSYPLHTSQEVQQKLSNGTLSIFDDMPFPNQPYKKASQWWILNREDVNTVIKHFEEFSTRHNKFKSIQNAAVDEVFFLSLLTSVNTNYRYKNKKTHLLHWLTDTGSFHPTIFNRLLPVDNEVITADDPFFVRKTLKSFTPDPFVPSKEAAICFIGTETTESYQPLLSAGMDLYVIYIRTADFVEKTHPEIMSYSKLIQLYNSNWKYQTMACQKVLERISKTIAYDRIYTITEKFNPKDYSVTVESGKSELGTHIVDRNKNVAYVWMPSSENDTTDSTDKKVSSSEVSAIELGDIIQLIAPSNMEYHQQSFLVNYASPSQIKLINMATDQHVTLHMDDLFQLTEESITEITILSRSEEKGFARQNKLLPDTWINVHFGGDVPSIITGKIQFIDEDQIEIKSYPGDETFYIDFQYRGIPVDIPIEKIVIRNSPSTSPSNTDHLQKSAVEDPTERVIEMTHAENGDNIYKTPDRIKVDETTDEYLNTIFADPTEIFGESLDDIVMAVEVAESEKKYDIQNQATSMIDEFLSKVPHSQRTLQLKNKVHIMVERYKQLRTLFSTYDEYGNITGRKLYGDSYKPLADALMKLDTKIKWIMPIVAAKRKLYKPFTSQDLLDENDNINNFYNDYNTFHFDSELFKEADQLELFDKPGSDGDENKYEKHMAYLNEFTSNLMNMVSGPDDILISKHAVNADMEMLVSVSDDFSSTSMGEDSMITSKNFIQRYNLGESRISEITRGKVPIQTKVIPNPKVDVRGLLMLPMPVVQYSQVYLPGTDIMTKTAHSQNAVHLSKILNSKRKMNLQNIESLDNELVYDDGDNSEQLREIVPFLKYVNHYVLNKSLYDGPSQQIYKQFLDVVIPKIRPMIRALRGSMKNRLSFVSVVKALEPFHIYTDNITIGQYSEIKSFIGKMIYAYKGKYKDSSKEFTALRTLANINHNEKYEPELKLFFIDVATTNTFKDMYKTDTKLFDSEILNSILKTDNGRLFAELIQYQFLPLLTPDSVVGIEKHTVDEMTFPDNNTEKCVRRVLAKRYSSMAELKNDDTIDDVFFDKDLDDTPYGIIKEYSKEKLSMEPNVFLQFLSEVLVQKHQASRAIATEIASTLILGKRRVQDGEFAILKLVPTLPPTVNPEKLTKAEKEAIAIEQETRTKYMYYVRKSNHWIHDPSIESEAFIMSNELFCNLDSKCFNNSKLGVCEPSEFPEIRMKYLTQQKILNEVEKRYTISLEDMKHTVSENILYQTKIIQRMATINKINMYRNNLICYEMGKSLKKESTIISPFEVLRDRILAQPDFAKKQHNICMFVERCCREPILDDKRENPHWYYCTQTNIPLFPMSLYLLAKAFVYDNDYIARLARVCRDYGVQSDDGDNVVDKYSGYVLKSIEVVNEDMFNESGIKIMADELLEQDIADQTVEFTRKKEKGPKLYDNLFGTLVSGVYQLLSTNTDIQIASIEDFVMKYTVEFVSKQNIILSESAYKKMVKMETKRVLPSYELYREERVIMYTTAIFLIAIQVSIPSIGKSKTFLKCTRSFDGYPMSGEEDKSGIEYLACLIYNMKSKTEILKSISEFAQPELKQKGLKQKAIEERLFNCIKKFTDNNSVVDEQMKAKREYLMTHPDSMETPVKHNLNKWIHFLPPVVPFSIANQLSNTTKDYDNDTFTLIRKGHKDANSHISMYKSKTIQHTYGVVEMINEIVSKKDLLLVSKQVPYKDNACCNDGFIKKPMTYFIEENKSIELFIARSIKNEIISTAIHNQTKPNILFNNESTRIIRQPVVQSFEGNVYEAFFHYCNFDNELPIPFDLLPLMKEKPTFYDKNAPLKERIEMMKRHGKSLSLENLHELLTIVNRRRNISIQSTVPQLPIKMFKDYIEHLELAHSTIISEPLRKHLINLLKHYNPDKMVVDEPATATEFSKATLKLKDYLIKANSRMLTSISKFIEEHGNLGTGEFDREMDYIATIHKWSIDKSNSVFISNQFLKNTIYKMTSVYPNRILNKSRNKFKSEHWGLSTKHAGDISSILNKQDLQFNKFHNNDAITLFLNSLPIRAYELNKFVQLIPVQSSIEIDNQFYYSLFSEITLELLFSYCWYSCIDEWIEIANDKSLLDADFINKKRKQAKENALDKDKSERLYPNQIESDNIVSDELLQGQQSGLQKNVCELLLAVINAEKRVKTFINKPYTQISRSGKITREKEKDEIVKIFDDEAKDERQVELMMKQYKLGRWNVGMQKGLFKYDKGTYDREHATQPAPASQPVDLDQFIQEYDDENANAEEEGGINELTEDYMDGTYYAEDATNENDF